MVETRSAPIPLCRPVLTGNESAYLTQSLQSRHWCGDGSFSSRCSELIEWLTGSAKAFLTTSCTHALEVASLLVDLAPGDEVILPSFTFVSAANAIVLRGARPVFVDIRPDTLNIDERKIERVITDRTKAISIVHYAGVACAMPEIQAIAKRHRLPIIGDNAHGFLGSFRGQPLGSFGDVATLSFHETKNLACGEGGALILNREDWIGRAEMIREKGTNRGQFTRGQVDKYTWVEVGSSMLPAEPLAAILLAQLESRESLQKHRLEIWNTYFTGLQSWADSVGAQLPSIPDGAEHPAHLFYVHAPSSNDRIDLITHLRSRGITAAFHYVPLHTAPIGQAWGIVPEPLEVTDHAAATLVRLPLASDLTEEEVGRILAAVQEWTPRARSVSLARRGPRETRGSISQARQEPGVGVRQG